MTSSKSPSEKDLRAKDDAMNQIGLSGMSVMLPKSKTKKEKKQEMKQCLKVNDQVTSPKGSKKPQKPAKSPKVKRTEMNPKEKKYREQMLAELGLPSDTPFKKKGKEVPVAEPHSTLRNVMSLPTSSTPSTSTPSDEPAVLLRRSVTNTGNPPTFSIQRSVSYSAQPPPLPDTLPPPLPSTLPPPFPGNLPPPLPSTLPPPLQGTLPPPGTLPDPPSPNINSTIPKSIAEDHIIITETEDEIPVRSDHEFDALLNAARMCSTNSDESGSEETCGAENNESCLSAREDNKVGNEDDNKVGNEGDNKVGTEDDDTVFSGDAGDDRGVVGTLEHGKFDDTGVESSQGDATS